MKETMELKVNETVVDAAEDIVVASSNGSLKKLGIVGGLVALGVTGYLVVKKLRNRKENAIESPDVDVEEVELSDEYSIFEEE